MTAEKRVYGLWKQWEQKLQLNNFAEQAYNRTK